jgi:hypothetical protein
MGELAIDVGMASPASSDVPTANRGTSAFEKTTFLKHCHTCSGGPRGPAEAGVGEDLVDQVREEHFRR